jgi:hypothetical protein
MTTLFIYSVLIQKILLFTKRLDVFVIWNWLHRNLKSPQPLSPLDKTEKFPGSGDEI